MNLFLNGLLLPNPPTKVFFTTRANISGDEVGE
jgi:hypothetical protein